MERWGNGEAPFRVSTCGALGVSRDTQGINGKVHKETVAKVVAHRGAKFKLATPIVHKSCIHSETAVATDMEFVSLSDGSDVERGSIAARLLHVVEIIRGELRRSVTLWKSDGIIGQSRLRETESCEKEQSA